MSDGEWTSQRFSVRIDSRLSCSFSYIRSWDLARVLIYETVRLETGQKLNVCDIGSLVIYRWSLYCSRSKDAVEFIAKDTSSSTRSFQKLLKCNIAIYSIYYVVKNKVQENIQHPVCQNRQQCYPDLCFKVHFPVLVQHSVSFIDISVTFLTMSSSQLVPVVQILPLSH